MKVDNPFMGLMDIAERIDAPELTFERYSTEPFNAVFVDIMKPVNCFIVGRTGVGKTMILSIFNPLYQKTLFDKNYLDKNHPEYKTRIEIANLVPNNVIGIYYSIGNAYLALDRFQGKGLKKFMWVANFGDYFGHLLLEDLINTINTLFKNKKWKDHNKIKDYSRATLDKVALEYSKVANKYIDYDVEIQSWDDLYDAIKKRISKWEKAVGQVDPDNYIGPKSNIELILPVLILKTELINQNIINKKCRFFIIIDQYEQLYEHIVEHEENIDYRPIFNTAMNKAHRSRTAIEFKIGVRPYAYLDNLHLYKSGAKLDLLKESIVINLDKEARTYYKDFINDLTEKILNRSGQFRKHKPNEILQIMDPIEEVAYYIGNTSKLNNHFARFFRRSPRKEKLIGLINEITKNLESNAKKVWIQTLLCIFIENKNLIRNNLSVLKIKIQNEYNKILSGKDNRNYEGALFIISASYQHRDKIFAGYETIKTVSSNVVMVYIDIMSEIFQLYNRKNPEQIIPIPAKVQSEAVHMRVNRIMDQLTNTISQGITIRRFLLNLGYTFRRLQLDPALKYPIPNGFSLKHKLYETLGEDEIQENKLLNNLLSYGFLEQKKHGDVNLKDTKRYKYLLNKVLCPYFNISVKPAKQPPYILTQDGKFFLRTLIHEDLNLDKIERYFKRNGKIDKGPIDNYI